MSDYVSSKTVKSATTRKNKPIPDSRRVVSADTSKRVAANSRPNGTNCSPHGGLSRKAMPSDKLNPKVIDPFQKASSGPQSKFASLYSSGAVPCRLMHGSVRHKLQWDSPPENLNFDPLLVTLAEGLRETKHPYSFIAVEGFKQLLDIPDAEARVLPLIGKLIPPIRLALNAKSPDVFRTTLDAIVQLSNVVGPALNPHLRSILPLLGKQMLSKSHKEPVTLALQHIEFNGGKECVCLIKARVPTYSSVYN